MTKIVASLVLRIASHLPPCVSLEHNRIQQLETGKIMIPPGPRLGDRVISVQGLKKSYEGRVLFDNVNFELVSLIHRDLAHAFPRLKTHTQTCRWSSPVWL